MARIPSEDIERLKQDVALTRLIEAQGLKLQKKGKDWALNCPFHDEDTPSLIVTPSKNLWHCFGCGAGGTVIDWVMKTEGVSFRHAVELLRERYLGSPSSTASDRDTKPAIKPTIKPVKQSTTRKLDAPLTLSADDQVLLNQVADYYHRRLKEHPDALAYLESRGLTHPELIDTFKLGVADRTLAYRLPQKNRKDGALIRTRLQTIGILRESGHEHFNGSLVIPVHDENGNVVELYGRKFTRDTRLRKGTPLHLYLPGPHRGVFNRAAFASKELILCESLIDALTFWCAGYRNVTASYGVNGFTDEHLEQLKKNTVECVLIAYDRDEAGNRAADALAKKLISESIDCYRVLFPKGMDANAYAYEVKPASKSLGVAIRSAEWMGNGKKPAKKNNITTVAVDGVQDVASEMLAKPADTKPIEAIEDAQIHDSAADQKEPSSLAAELEQLAESLNEPLPAQRVPDAPTEPAAEITDTDIRFTFGNRTYRVRGFERTAATNALKINLLVSGPGLNGEDAFHVDTLDLYHARARGVFINHAALELGVKDDVIKADLGQVLLKLETLQEERRQAQTETDKPVELSADDTRAALALLKSPNLLERIVNDFTHCGLVGENVNALVGYLAAVSRKLNNPLAIIVQSTSAAGKSALMDAVLAMMPPEERVQYSAMTGQSLYYMSEQNLKHKILAIVEEEGAERASYALKLLQSEGELTIASTSKDPQSGKLVTQEYRVEGPVMIFLTTTAIDIDEELLNRCLVLTVNEDRQQTQAIHAAQRRKRTLDGLLAKAEKESLLTLHRNAQRLLRPLAVVNPYAEHLTFLDHQTRTRRDHEKYLTLIDVIALLHQHQRPIKTVSHAGKTLEYLEATLDDIAAANRLAHDILGRTLDELPPQTRKLLTLIDQMVRERCESLAMKRGDYRFTRKDVRDYTAWGNTQLKLHLGRLEDMEYLLIHRGGRGQSFVYELLYDGKADQGPRLPGLIDVEALKNKNHDYDAEKSGPGRGDVGPKSAGGRADENGVNASNNNPLAADDVDDPEKPHHRSSAESASYPHALIAKGA